MQFSKNDQKILKHIIKSRGDVRGNNFLNKKIKKNTLKKILDSSLSAPSVGYSQPWKFVVIQDQEKKQTIYQNFSNEYENSKKHFTDNNLYNSLKLEGIQEAPVNIAIFYEKPTKKVLGQTSNKKMGEYSVVCAVQNMWLTARAHNIGIGWVSILNHKNIRKTLNINKNYKLVAYLCVGYVKEFYKKPELEILQWEKKKEFHKVVSWV